MGAKTIKDLPFGKARGPVGVRGYKVSKRPSQKNPRYARMGRKRPHANFVREVVRESTGLLPYERRLLELVRNGLDKRALKLAKRRIGTHHLAKKKRDFVIELLNKQRLAK